MKVVEKEKATATLAAYAAEVKNGPVVVTDQGKPGAGGRIHPRRPAAGGEIPQARDRAGGGPVSGRGRGRGPMVGGPGRPRPGTGAGGRRGRRCRRDGSALGDGRVVHRAGRCRCM